MNENKEKTAGNLANSVVEGYDYSVAVRMSGRAGAYSPTGGKGNAFEVMYSDKKNLSNLLKPDNNAYEFVNCPSGRFGYEEGKSHYREDSVQGYSECKRNDGYDQTGAKRSISNNAVSRNV